jgi:hypothetical protein
MLLVLGNLWNAYKGPEGFLEMATGTAGEIISLVALLLVAPGSLVASGLGLAWCLGGSPGGCTRLLDCC